MNSDKSDYDRRIGEEEKDGEGEVKRVEQMSGHSARRRCEGEQPWAEGEELLRLMRNSVASLRRAR